MSRQDKATTERHARELRELVKQSDNKMCADCRKNDARWASWNLGVFVCIRCSGIHRSMGTHISKVKSIDLDIWQPEQLANIKKWGNRRANMYWERHLKAGHIPPDHKIESFIRSKYESRRWAMEGPVPIDPSVLDGGDGVDTAPPVPIQSRPTPTSSAPPARVSTSGHVPSRVAHPLLSTASPRQHKQIPQIDLLNADFGESSTRSTETASAEPPVPASAPAKEAPTLAPVVGTTQPTPAPPSSGLFDLDFRPPSQTKISAPTNKKSDIMSLFSTPSAAPPMATHQMYTPGVQANNPYASWSGGGTDTSAVQQNRPREASLSGGMAGMNMGGNVWDTPVTAPVANQQSNTFSSQYSQPTVPISQPQTYGNNNSTSNHFFSTQDVWGSGATVASPAISPPNVQKQVNDPFANIWK